MSVLQKEDGTINRILWLVATGVVFTLVTALIQVLAPRYFETKTDVEVTCKCAYPDTTGVASSPDEEEED